MNCDVNVLQGLPETAAHIHSRLGPAPQPQGFLLPRRRRRLPRPLRENLRPPLPDTPGEKEMVTYMTLTE